MTNSFIYGLVDPETQELRYVGKTRVGMKRALADHSARCRNWIIKLRRHGLTQEVVILEETDELDEAERRLISLFRRLSHPLTNIADGGEGRRGSVSEEARARITEANRRRLLGKHHSLETRRKLSLSHLGKKHKPGDRTKFIQVMKKRSDAGLLSFQKAVRCINDGLVFPSVGHAAVHYNVQKTNVSAVCLGKRKTTGGMRFEFVMKG